jgi:hypothetical protein
MSRAGHASPVGLALLMCVTVGCATPAVPNASHPSSRAPDRLIAIGPTAILSNQPSPPSLPTVLEVLATPTVFGASSAPLAEVVLTPTPAGPIAKVTNPPAGRQLAVKIVPALPGQPTVPRIPDVAQRPEADLVRYLRGQLPDYSSSGPSSIVDFSPSDILETMDTVVLDQVKNSKGDAAVQRIYDTIARSILATILEEYPGRTVVVALDAGHGGKPGYFWDPGSEGTEAIHTRAVAQAIARQARQLTSGDIIIRPIYNDSMADDLGVAGPQNRPIVNQLVTRQVRAAMLADDVTAWNRANPAAPVALHEISVHFNSGAGGALVLHQGDAVRPEFRDRSIDFGEKYLERVIAGLNATGVLPTPLRRWGGSGLHDDVMLYRPDYLNGLALPTGFTPHYAMLQGGSYLQRYASLVVSNAN